MKRRFLSLLPSWPDSKDLQDARAVLGQVAPIMHLEDRRNESRRTVPETRQIGISALGAVVNLSKSGFAIQVPEKCRFARGESHRLLLQVGNGSVDVEGRVRWTRSHWNGEVSANEAEFLQMAGFEFPDSLPVETELVLRIVREMVQSEGVQVDVKEIEVTRRCSSETG